MAVPVARKTVDFRAAGFFEKQRLEDPANAVCCDHAGEDAQWASVTHGIYISIRASGAHRSLGVKTSFVLSTAMDSWKPEHLRMMELGGNRRFQEFLRAHGVDENIPIRQKYITRAADWYRKNLLALVEGATPPEPLLEGTGQLPVAVLDIATQRMLDEIYAAEAPDGMTAGGVPAKCRMFGVAALCGWCCRKNAALSIKDPSRTQVNLDKPAMLPTLIGLRGHLAAMKLQSVSTVKMNGFNDGMSSQDSEDMRLFSKLSGASLQQLVAATS